VLSTTTGIYSYSAIATVGSGVTSYVDTGAITGANSYNNLYEVMAVFPGGVDSTNVDAVVGESSDLPASNVSVTANLVRNSTGRWQVMLSSLPTNMLAVQLFIAPYDYEWDDLYSAYEFTNNVAAFFDSSSLVETVPMAYLTNGEFVIPDSIMTNEIGNNQLGKIVGVLPIATRGRVGTMSLAGILPYDAPCFVDGRQHLKQNLLFELRGATISQPVGLVEYNVWFDPFFENISVPGNTNVVESSIFHWSEMFKAYDDLTPAYVKMDDLWPITVNYELNDELYNTNYTGPASFVWETNLVAVPAPAVLGISDPYWISEGLGNLADVAAYTSGGNLYLRSGARNLFGLAFTTALVDTPGFNYYPYTEENLSGSLRTLNPGAYITVADVSTFYSQTVDPSLQLTNYYFAQVITPGTALPLDSTPSQVAPLPCLPGFASTNQTGLLVASVGTPEVIGGWAKFSVQNSASNAYAYLGQYFVTNGFVMTNGLVTTNTTGIVSPYGNFFPTQPGLVAMATMPDINTGVQGTGVVRVISLNVDANHDGVMDFSYRGPDFVSTSKPFRFWANDDQDSGDYGGNGGVPEYEPFSQADGYMLGQFETVPAFTSSGVKNFTDIVYNVHGRRDLVDFFPVYLNVGSLFQSNALSAGISLADTNYQFVLSQADGTLRFVYTELSPTNYMNYLRDTNESGSLANAIAWPIYPTGTVLNSIWITGTNNLFSDIATNNRGIILVEAATNTTQPLVLTLYHGTNQIAQTMLPLSITGVEQMFRSKNLLLESDSRAVPDRLIDSAVPNEPDTTDTNFVFIHGYNVNPTQARGVAADMYKRMYWSGSHAKFWAVTWYGYDTQGSFGLPGLGDVTCDYQINVDHAFNTASNLSVFLSSLPGGPITVAAHSLGNMLTLSALNDWNAPIANYFMMDAAVAVEAIDPSASPQPAMVFSSWASTNNYASRLYASDWWTMFTNNDARSTLTWSNRLGHLHSANVYNYYSSGEEVLRTNAADPPLTSIGATAASFANYFASHSPISSFVWVWQEKSKGVGLIDTVLGSTHGGWKFNTNAPYYYTNNGVLTHMPNSQASVLPASQLQTNAFFDTSYDYLLFSPISGSAYATLNGNRILSDAIPALTWPVGSNPVPKFTPNDQNIDMMTLENGWPVGRGSPRWPSVTTAFGEWHHSDFHEVAYTFTYHLFDQFVTVGNLK
jgi:pimeloyl-ACP methyl ester carboxylesterase